MKIKLRLLLLSYIIIFRLAAQESGVQYPYVHQIIPPSPTVASLGKYGNIPVSNYTGIPNISIPLYTIKSGEIELPITLSYYSSGIKVSEEASWVGLGWSLNAGGVITRSVRGLDDLRQDGYLNRIELPSSNDDVPDLTNLKNLFHNYELINSGALDGEPDIFYYNFGGYSGKMIFEKSSGPDVKGIPLDQTNSTFSYNIPNKQWTVTDERGWKYYLGTIEETQNYSVSGNNSFKYTRLDTIHAINGTVVYPLDDHHVISAWYLDRIETPQGDKITFQYDTRERETIGQTSCSEGQHQQYVPYREPTGLSDVGNGDITTVRYYYKSANMQLIRNVYLNKIEFNNGYVKFNTEDRSDMRQQYSASSFNIPMPQRLSNMQVFNLSNIPYKKIDFNYSYFNEDKNSYNKENFWRLKLNSIQESYYNETSNSYSNLPPYTFEYNYIPLPAKNSANVDYWGYYNGYDNDRIPIYINRITEAWDCLASGSPLLVQNSTDVGTQKFFIPRPIFKDPEDLLPSGTHLSGTHSFMDGANREPNPLTMQAAILNKINYPTGGATRFTYEPNAYNAYDDTKAYPTEDKFYDVNAISADFDPDIASFTLTQYAQLWITCKIENWGSINSPGAYKNIKATIRNANGSEIVSFKPTNEYNPFTANIQIFLPPGDYQLVADNNRDEDVQIDLKASYVVRELNEIKIGGGLRISKMENLDNMGQTLETKKYDYNEYYGSAGLSTGLIMTPINQFYFEGEVEGDWEEYLLAMGITTYNHRADNILVRTSENQLPLGTSASGNFVGYSKVTVSNVGKGDTSFGKSVYEYINKPDKLSTYHVNGVPGTPNLDNGKMIKEEHYNDKGNIVKRIEFKYKKNESSTIINKGIVTPTAIYRTAGAPNYTGFCFYLRFYEIPSEWWCPIADTTYVYSLDGSGKFIKTYNSYQYNNVNHKLLTNKKTENSIGQLSESIYRYTGDVNQGVYSSMVGLNMLNYPIEIIDIKNGYIVGSKLTTYKINGSSYVPDKVYKLEFTTPFSVSGFTYFDGLTKDSHYGATPEISYDLYNTTNGNQRQTTTRDGITTAYLWDSNGIYPMSQVKGATYSQINTQDGKACTYSSNTLWTDLNNIAPKAVVNTYEYYPLIGLKCITDPRGVTTNFNYDDFSRLLNIKDYNGNLQKTYNYHYKQ